MPHNRMVWLNVKTAIFLRLPAPLCFRCICLNLSGVMLSLLLDFLINRMPSSVLGGSIPFKYLFPNSPLFPLIARILGCVCFVHLFELGPDKLSLRAIFCIFMGYSRTQKGYRCYDPLTKKWLVSADIIFFESEPFF